MAVRKIKRLKGASKVDAAIRGMGSIVDFGSGLNFVVVSPSRDTKSVPAHDKRPRGPILPPSKFAASYGNVHMKDSKGRIITVRDLHGSEHMPSFVKPKIKVFEAARKAPSSKVIGSDKGKRITVYTVDTTTPERSGVEADHRRGV